MTPFNAFLSITNPIEKEAVQYLQSYLDLIHRPATILRLADDLGTSLVNMLQATIILMFISSLFFKLYLQHILILCFN